MTPKYPIIFIHFEITIKAHATWIIKTLSSNKDVILSVMTKLSYATHDSQCTKQNMWSIITLTH